MPGLSRFGVSLSRHLLQSLDQWLRRKGFANRSQAIAELIRDRLVKEEWHSNGGSVIGTVTLVYDPDHHVLSHSLTKTQHAHHDAIICSQHVHLDERNCLEVIVLKGRARDVKELADHLQAMKGIKHGQCLMTTTGEDLPH